MINGYQSKILDIYTKIQDEERRLLTKRINDIQKLHPEIIKVDNYIQKLSLQMSLSILKSDDSEKTLKEFKRKITDLKVQKYEMLVSSGYDSDYLSLHYRCPKCNDTGFIGVNKCYCYKQKLIKIYYQNSLLEDILKEKNFGTFNINIFSSHKLGDEKYSPRKNMENIYSYVLGEYIPNFKSANTNLLFYGNPGSGKSFLSYCIAKELLDSGHLVVYKTSDELISDLRDIRFNNNYKLNNLLMNCDLLIIDDLGAEQTNDFAITELFNLLNKKLLQNKKMLISTNLFLPGITQVYSERIYSRLIGEFKLCKFFEEDLRIKLNLKKR